MPKSSRWVSTNKIKTVFVRVVDEDFLQVVDKSYNKNDGTIEHDFDLSGAGIQHGEYALAKIVIPNATEIVSVRRIEKLEPQAYSVIMANTSVTTSRDVVSSIISSYNYFNVFINDENDFYHEVEGSETMAFILSKNQDRYDCHLFLEKIADNLFSEYGENRDEFVNGHFEVVKTDEIMKDNLDLTFYLDAQNEHNDSVANIQFIGGDYWLPKDVVNFIPIVENIVEARNKVNIMTLGESGSGKTTFAIKLAEHLEYNYSYVNAYDITDPNQWFSKETAHKGTTKTKGINLHTALKTGRSVVLIDEINRVSTDLANPLMSVLDNRNEFQVDGVIHKLADKLIIVASANIGFGYFGTFSMDMALKNRFTYTLKFGDLPDDVAIHLLKEKFGFKLSEANRLFCIFDDLRAIIRNDKNGINVSMSTRTLEDFAFSITSGMSVFETFKFLVFNKIHGIFPKELEEFVVKHGGVSLSEEKRFSL
jgi:midasin (ATPase involved in ribosome maturation)